MFVWKKMELSCNEFFATNMEIKTTASKRLTGKKETSSLSLSYL